MTKKLLFIDTETTGTIPGQHGMIQLGVIVDIWSGGVLTRTEEKSWLIQPHRKDFIAEKALEVNRRTGAEIMTAPFRPPLEVVPEVITFLDDVVNKYDKTDKLHPCGYNVGFDVDFLAAWFKKVQFDYFFSYLNNQRLDPMSYAFFLTASGLLETENHKLETIAKEFGIEFGGEGAHDAMSDVTATRELFYHMQRNFSWKGQPLHLSRELEGSTG
ncbi:MAG TPA: 3'-5' exonuclease [Armatimonadota bacterium]|nr:3'-5' exonuclease [Armatimonadota bacterium]